MVAKQSTEFWAWVDTQLTRFAVTGYDMLFSMPGCARTSPQKIKNTFYISIFYYKESANLKTIATGSHYVSLAQPNLCYLVWGSALY
jgi:hypothetical protein